MIRVMKTNLQSFNGTIQSATRPLFGWCFLALLLALVWAGPRYQAKAADDINPAGNYTLLSVNGSTVPCTLTHEGSSISIKTGVFIINSDGTCSSKIVFTLPSNEEASRVVKATYTREGTKLTMKWEGAGMTTGNVISNTFTMNNEGMVFVYRK